MLLVLLATVAQATSPSIVTKGGELVFQATDFKFNGMNQYKYTLQIQETKAKIQNALANDEDAQLLLDQLKELNAQMASEPDDSFTLRTFETNIAANANKTAELKASVDSLVTDTIAGIQDDIAKSENTQASARTALENKLEQSLAAKEKEIYKATDSLEAENVKVDSCGKAGKLYTKGGCKTIEIPDTNLAKYTSKGCDIANSGRLEYNSVSGQMCLMLCSAGKWTAINEGKYGEQCNAAKDCAEVASKKVGSGVFQFISSVSNGVITHTKEAYCDVVTKKLSYDGSSAKKYALSCDILYRGYPFVGNGEFYIGENEKAAKKTGCKKYVPPPPGPDARVPTNSLIAWWDAADWNGDSSWGSRGGKGAKPHFQGSRPSRVNGGEGAHPGYKSIKGYTNTHRINWGNIVRGTWTLCTTSKYDGSSKGRIFTGSGNNWLHGHWGGHSGSSYYQGWKVNGALQKKRDQWLAWCATNGQSRSVWGNTLDYSGAKKYAGGVSTSTNSVGTGTGTHSGEASHYRIGSVISWDRSFSEKEMKLMTEYLVDRIKGRAN